MVLPLLRGNSNYKKGKTQIIKYIYTHSIHFFSDHFFGKYYFLHRISKFSRENTILVLARSLKFPKFLPHISLPPHTLSLSPPYFIIVVVVVILSLQSLFFFPLIISKTLPSSLSLLPFSSLSQDNAVS